MSPGRVRSMAYSCETPLIGWRVPQITRSDPFALGCNYNLVEPGRCRSFVPKRVPFLSPGIRHP